MAALETKISFSVPLASSSLMSSVTDMLKWQNALNQHLIVNDKTVKKAFTKYKLNNGQEFLHGYGWHLKETNGTPIRTHRGSVFGFKAMGVYIPNEVIYVANSHLRCAIFFSLKEIMLLDIIHNSVLEHIKTNAEG